MRQTRTDPSRERKPCTLRCSLKCAHFIFRQANLQRLDSLAFGSFHGIKLATKGNRVKNPFVLYCQWQYSMNVIRILQMSAHLLTSLKGDAE